MLLKEELEKKNKDLEDEVKRIQKGGGERLWYLEERIEELEKKGQRGEERKRIDDEGEERVEVVKEIEDIETALGKIERDLGEIEYRLNSVTTIMPFVLKKIAILKARK